MCRLCEIREELTRLQVESGKLTLKMTEAMLSFSNAATDGNAERMDAARITIHELTNMHLDGTARDRPQAGGGGLRPVRDAQGPIEITSSQQETKMIDSEKRAFGGWWLWILLLIVVTVVVFFGLRFTGVVGERIIFEQSFQRQATEDARRDALRAELTAIETRLRSGELSDTQRADLEAQAAGVRYQLNSMGD